MNKSFKQLMIKLARLHKSDQRWILSQLSTNQKLQFEQLNGHQLLQKAKKFCFLKGDESSSANPALDSQFENLAQHNPLYIAIILSEGKFSWQNDFLSQFDQESFIKQAIQQRVPSLKTQTTQALFAEWMSKASFDVYLEKNDG